jgi:glycosyltransferase involved in cell wall biosynthesis
MKQHLRVSIVIPVYNEAAHLGACLEAISRQSVRPYEVIVVDNNSTDGTREVALGYDFVTVLHERRQGVVYARDKGFNSASGDVIGRLDADSLIATDWVETAQQLFSDNKELAAVTGKVSYYGLAFSSLLDELDLRIRRRMARLLGREVAMQGANMAIRRSAWLDVRGQLCRKGNMHEDFDISIHLAKNQYLVAFDERLTAAIDCRRLEANWAEFRAYAWLSPKTYSQHNLTSQRHMYPIVVLVLLFYLPLKLLHRGFDRRTERFSWRLAFAAPVQGRVNPATFVD